MMMSCGWLSRTLAAETFRAYLIQDYLFLIQFARAFALAAYKSDTMADLKVAVASLGAIVEQEMSLHIRYCAGWGLSEAEMARPSRRLPKHWPISKRRRIGIRMQALRSNYYSTTISMCAAHARLTFRPAKKIAGRGGMRHGS